MLLLTIIIASIFTIYLMAQSEEHQNASAYLLLWCLPLLFYLNKSRLVQAAIILSIVAIMLTVKRGAMIALVASLLAYFLALLKISDKIINKFRVFFISILIFGTIALVVYNKWDLVSDRFADKGGSGRDNLYGVIIKSYLGGNLQEIVFGNGISSVERLTAASISKNPYGVGVTAHSDWLQFVHDFGLMGFIVMILLHFKFLKMLTFHSKHKTDLLPILLATYLIFGLTTIYSFILSTPDAIYMGIIIALMSVETNRMKLETTPDVGNF